MVWGKLRLTLLESKNAHRIKNVITNCFESQKKCFLAKNDEKHGKNPAKRGLP